LIRLRDLEFSDLYISVDCEVFIRGGSDQPGICAPNDAVASDLVAFHTMLMLHSQDKKEFALRYDGVLYRVAAIYGANSRWFVCRRGLSVIPALLDIGLPRGLCEILMASGSQPGLHLVVGGKGQGKTTTAASILSAWFHQHGDVGLLMEQLLETPLEGAVGRIGWCFQVEVETGVFAETIEQALKWRPAFMMVGELKHPEDVLMVLRAVESGVRVISTQNANNVIEALQALYRITDQDKTGHASMMLAQNLSVLLCQETIPAQKQIAIEVLLNDQYGENIVSELIRHRRYDELSRTLKSAGGRSKQLSS